MGRRYRNRFRSNRKRHAKTPSVSPERSRSYERKHDQNKRWRADEESMRIKNSEKPEMDASENKNAPTNVCVILGVGPNIMESDIWSAVSDTTTKVREIRLLRNRTSITLRGFAFIEFDQVEDAVEWMDKIKGYVTFPDKSVGTVEFSRSVIKKGVSDWICKPCGLKNFSRRDSCFKCGLRRMICERGEEDDEISHILTKKIMIRNLSLQMTEDDVINILQKYLPDTCKRISKIHFKKDCARPVCYINFCSLVDSMNVFNTMNDLNPPLTVDQRPVTVHYCIDHENRNLPTASNESTISKPPYIAAEMNENHTLSDVPRLANYSASLYATNSVEHAKYLSYYTKYYTDEIINEQAKKAKQAKLNADGDSDVSNGAPLAIQQEALVGREMPIPNGKDGKTYPTPNISSYQYDDATGYFFDHSTGLLYDAHSHYYYNNETGAYLYWDESKKTYILATPSSEDTPSNDSNSNQSETKTRKAETPKTKIDDPKSVNVHTAKKIAKEMEKWAKQLNEKKEYINSVVAARAEPAPEPDENPKQKPNSYADICFSLLSKDKNAYSCKNFQKIYLKPTSTNDALSMAAATRRETQIIKDNNNVDYDRIACLLCQRAFPSLDVLEKHLSMSTLHKENVQKKLAKSPSPVNSDYVTPIYRDRAKELRLRCGDKNSPPPPNKTRELFDQQREMFQKRQTQIAAMQPTIPQNVGNSMMKKMGWNEGEGLGRHSQGASNIIEVNAQKSNVGLGTNNNLRPIQGETYNEYLMRKVKKRYDAL